MLDQREAGDTKDRVRLDRKTLERNFPVAPAAPAVVVGLHQAQGLLDVAQLVKGPDPDLNGKILPEFAAGLVDWVRVYFRLLVGEQREVSIGQ
jgi:hypothetical protein